MLCQRAECTGSVAASLRRPLMNRRLSQPTHQQELSDRLLIEHACAGDDSAFAILVQRYHGQVYRLLCACPDGDQGDDGWQLVWHQCYRFLATLESNPPP